MSDITFIFPFWFEAGFALIVALPVTTVILLGLGIAAYRRRRVDPGQPLAAFKWMAIIIGAFWLGGLGFDASMLIGTMRARIDEAQRYFTLDMAAEIDGITLPAGTRVELDESHALKLAELPDGAIVTLRGATWRGKIEFSEPGHMPGGGHGLIIRGILAAAAVVDGIPCRGGSEAAFFW